VGPTRLAFAYARRRPLSTLLVVLLAALGTAVVVLTLAVAREVAQRLERDAAGIDLVVGAKGSPLQLVLAGVFHVDVPPGNIPLAAVAELRAHPMVASAIPLALGDSVQGFRIVGTEPALLDHYGARLADGRAWDAPMEAVLGSEVARATGLRVGGEFAGAHGLSEGGGEHADARYRVVGILAPTGRPIDRMALTPVESVWTVHDAHHPPAVLDNAGASGGRGDKDHDHDHDHDHEQGQAAVEASQPPREVTLLLVRYATPLAATSLPRAINSGTNYVAASPAYETARLLTVFGVGLDLLRGFALLLVAASALMLFVALAQALDERRYDLAILRALGAHRAQVAWVLVAESVALALAGAALGWVLAQLVISVAGTWLPAAGPTAEAAWALRAEDAWVAAGALAVGILAALWPGWQAYRLDVSATLADS
jgi:putative ABC transport system permease protein